MNSLAIVRNARWCVVPLFALAILGISVSDIVYYSGGRLHDANEWDILLEMFNDPFKVAVLLPAVYFTMIADTATRDLDGWGYMIWNRGMSRAQWWWSKIGALCVTTFIYTNILWLVALFASLFLVRFESHWSKFVFLSHWSYQGGLTVHQLLVPPPIIMLKIWGLITIGLYALSVCVVLLAFVFHHAGIAWMIGAATSIISYGIWVKIPQASAWAPTLHLVLLTHYGFSSKAPAYFSCIFSIVGGFLLIIIIGAIGHLLVLKREF
ncbi:hypothetical protein [Geobacillus thermocatenulatus]|nr:hypothetical protein [Geobacillus thermocatenulatus]